MTLKSIYLVESDMNERLQRASFEIIEHFIFGPKI